MNVICSKCNAEIAAKYTNESKGLAYCESCQDYFLLDKHLMRKPRLLRQEEKYKKRTKPNKSKIEVKESYNGHTIIVPKGKLPLVTQLFTILFLVAIGYALYESFSKPQDHDLESYLIMGMFTIIEVFLILVLILKGHDTIINLNEDRVQINRNRYVLPAYSKEKKTKYLNIIDTYYESGGDEGGSETGVEMIFEDEKYLRFGSSLKTEEQEWLAGQLILIRDSLMLDDKVLEDLKSKLSEARSNPIIVNISKPLHSNIIESNRAGYFSLVIPKDRYLLGALGFLFIYLLTLVMVSAATLGFWGYLPILEYHPVLKYVSFAFMLLVLYAFLFYLFGFIYRAEHRVLISAREIKVELQPFGIPISKVRKTKSLKEIKKSRDWNFILLKFDNERDLRVGFSLTKKELKFLIGKLTSMVQDTKHTANRNS